MPSYYYDVALSFAGEDRDKAEALALALVQKQVRVFYDKFEEHDIWGKDLVEYLHNIYANRARFCIPLISRYYVQKAWPRFERQSAQERALYEESEYLLPIRLDDTPVPGLPTTIAYVWYEEHTVDELADLVVRKLGRPTSDLQYPRLLAENPVEVANRPDASTFVFRQDQRFLKHEKLTAILLPFKEQYGYYAIHTLSVPVIQVPGQRIRDTFLDPTKAYSETLRFASSLQTHPDGYTRGYEARREGETRETSEATTCYFDGHIVTEGYLDTFFEGNYSLNPNWFTYKIQRHLQLCKEVLADLASKVFCAVTFDHISRFKWAIYQNNKICKEKPYVGYHGDIIFPIEISAIHGRDKWNLKMDVVESIMIEIARIFGMDGLPQRYWNESGELDYARWFPTR